MMNYGRPRESFNGSLCKLRGSRYYPFNTVKSNYRYFGTSSKKTLPFIRG